MTDILFFKYINNEQKEFLYGSLYKKLLVVNGIKNNIYSYLEIIFICVGYCIH